MKIPKYLNSFYRGSPYGWQENSYEKELSMRRLVYSSRDHTEMFEIGESRINKLIMPSHANLTEFIACLAGEQSNANMANNIYLLSIMFPYLDVGAPGIIRFHFHIFHIRFEL